jgi:putative ABC transport system permease protein
MSLLLQDIKYALRGLRRVPGFALVAVLTLALGIGANTAIFSVVNGVILRPLGYPRPEQLVYITSQFPSMGFNQFWMSAPEFFEFRERNRSFSAVGAYTTGALNIEADGRPSRETAAQVSASLFTALGVQPSLGRTFTEEETLPTAAPTVVLSNELWQAAFASDSLIIGKQITIDATKATVIGVMPPGFDVHDQRVRIWTPLQLDPAERTRRRASHYLYAIGRMKPGVTLQQAKSELNTLLAQWPAANGATANARPGQPGFVHTPDDKQHRLRFDDLRTDVVGSVRTALWVLQAAVGLVLLIACANMANLLLMRAESRHKEIAVRAALGAGRSRLLRQFVAEGLVLSLGGAAVGLALAKVGLKVLVASNAGSIPRSASVDLDAVVLTFTLLLAVGTGVLFGLAPLLHLGSRSVGLALRDGGSRTTATTARHRIRRGLAVAEVALAVMLVVGAGLLIRSFWNLMRVDAGFDRGQLTTFNVVLPARQYADSMRRVAFFDDLSARLAAIPGVKAVAEMSGLPPMREVNANDTEFEGIERTPNAPAQNVDYYQIVSPNYVATMGIPVLAGRGFTSTDGQGAPPVVLVNQTLAKLFYPSSNPIGRRIRPAGVEAWFTIVGVLKDVKQGGVDAKTGSELYFSYPQLPLAFGSAPRNMHVVLRSTRSTATLAPAIRAAVASLDPALPVVKLRSMDDVFSDAVSRPRFLAQLLGVFASVALALAALGTYGVLAYSVAERRREIGIRMALGADQRGVLGMVLAQGMTLAGGGLVLGMLGAVGLTRLASTLLFGVSPADPLTFGSVAAFILLVALAACVIPARRATRVDPLVALRQD